MNEGAVQVCCLIVLHFGVATIAVEDSETNWDYIRMNTVLHTTIYDILKSALTRRIQCVF